MNKGSEDHSGVRTLYLHIGQGKTGSSFLQASFANSRAALAEQGIDYPYSETGQALEWKISSGNGMKLLKTPPSELEISQPSALFSLESFFGVIASDGMFPNRLADICARFGFDRVRFLLFLRNPVAHAQSCYQQDVKRLGHVADVSEAFENYNMPMYVRMALQRDMGLPDAQFVIYNYDKHRSNLLPLVEGFLGVPAETLVSGWKREVNRSMSKAELMFQLGLNRHLGKHGSFFSDTLCNELPELPADPALPSVDVQKAMLDRLRPTLDAVNAMVPAGEGYVDDVQAPIPSEDFEGFTREQIETAADRLGAELAHWRGQAALSRAELALLRAKAALDSGVSPERDLTQATNALNEARALRFNIKRVDVFWTRLQALRRKSQSGVNEGPGA